MFMREHLKCMDWAGRARVVVNHKDQYCTVSKFAEEEWHHILVQPSGHRALKKAVYGLTYYCTTDHRKFLARDTARRASFIIALFGYFARRRTPLCLSILLACEL